jgi:geranylgeranyl diphosphate synthase, type II
MSERLSLALEFLEQSRQQIDQALERSIRDGAASPRLDEAMRYSVLGGGKRIRPALCLAAARAIGADPLAALAPACALELVHAYSLVHDDLPAFDEASAILAGDALQTLAFALLAEAPELSDQQRIAMIRELATASGHQGMVGGQAIDLESVGRQLTIEQLESMHRHKTGALIEASVRLGALTSGSVTDQQLAALSDFASALGLAFQVQDDLLDIEGDTEVIGKRQGSDAAREKPTYPALLGVSGAREHLEKLLDQAQSALDSFGDEAEVLRAMADYVVARSH